MNDISDHGIILHCIPSDGNDHPCQTKPSILFIKDVVTRKTHTISLTHQDVPQVVDVKTLQCDLNKLTGVKWVFNKKSFLQMMTIDDLRDAELLTFLYHNKVMPIEDHETLAHRMISTWNRGTKNLNQSVPIVKHIETFESLCSAFLSSLVGCSVSEGYKNTNSIVIETLSEVERNGIHVNAGLFSDRFDAEIYDDMVYSQYNIYTPTGRPSNHFQNVNYAALNKSDGTRKCFTSRYGVDGKLVLIDYSAFHPRIISHLTKFDLKFEVDIYKYLAGLYFHRDDPTDLDVEEAKILTMRQLYGGVEEQYKHIRYLSNISQFISTHWNTFESQGFIETPIFKRIISDKHCQDANPAKLFNYILQATETEIAIPTLKVVNDFLKPKLTKPILYTYDSILFDFHKQDGSPTLKEIMAIMMMDKRFPVKVYFGDNYEELKQIEV
jgi:hypothetical protein